AAFRDHPLVVDTVHRRCHPAERYLLAAFLSPAVRSRRADTYPRVAALRLTRSGPCRPGPAYHPAERCRPAEACHPVAALQEVSYLQAVSCPLVAAQATRLPVVPCLRSVAAPAVVLPAASFLQALAGLRSAAAPAV